ncbi:hypothetical protein ES703_73833 [subsurface metagenome]
MAILHWALKDIVYEVTKDGVQIKVFTFQPCHLWLRWTTKDPQEHLIPVIRRGLAIYSDKRFCFVAYHDNEQDEGDDTYVHTFLKEPWAHCETRFFYFHGKMGGERSPSTSAIFKYHRFAPEYWRIILEPWQVQYPPPPMSRIILEPWSASFEPPDLSRIILEEWTL